MGYDSLGCGGGERMASSDKMRKKKVTPQKDAPDLTQRDIMEKMLAGNGNIPDPADFNFMANPSSIIRHEDGGLEINSIKVHRVGLEFVGDISEVDWQVFGDTLVQFDTAYQWIIGDYLAYGMDNNYGKVAEFAELLGKSEQTVTNWVYISRHVEFYRRRENLSHAHHETVSSLPDEDQQKWLKLAEQGNGKEGDEHRIWSVKKLREEIANDRGDKLPESTSEPLYKKWDEQSEERLTKLLSYYKKETDKRKKNAWKRYIKSEAERWSNLLDQIDNL